MLAYSVEVWAAVGEWVGAVGTIGAVAVALWLARWDALRDKRRQKEGAEQAAFDVASVVVVQARYEDPEDWHPNVDNMPDARVTIHNLSGEPISFPRLELFAAEGGTVDWGMWVPPGQEDAAPSTVDVLPAGDTLGLHVTLKVKTYPEALHPIIGFTDRHNQRWRRRHSESPQRVLAGDTTPIGGPGWYRKAVNQAPGVPPALPPLPAEQ
ncbi:hypothetical protein ACFWUU_05335 [Kribbella sp. NPDC058693]|uniref:hypothetical protein n=1 Tax=Kribbella sp. NPDC058693 TaxID=3346602 RepID=UPI00364BAFAE